MTGRTWFPALVIIAFFVGTGRIYAQAPGPDEAVGPGGAVNQQVALTAAQKSAIYNAVMQQKVRASTTAVPAAVGAPVPLTVQLSELPDQSAAENPWASFLKYAMVEDDVVVVDPVSMRVVDVIHGGAKP